MIIKGDIVCLTQSAAYIQSNVNSLYFSYLDLIHDDSFCKVGFLDKISKGGGRLVLYIHLWLPKGMIVVMIGQDD